MHNPVYHDIIRCNILAEVRPRHAAAPAVPPSSLIDRLSLARRVVAGMASNNDNNNDSNNNNNDNINNNDNE